jgi:predicted  nucleic acid-binding Zn-ribbon protein
MREHKRMPRTPALDRGELKIRVTEAVQSLRGDGRTPTVSLARQWLTERYKSAGSQTILKDVLREVVEEIMAVENSGAPAIPMPAEVETVIQASIQTVWRVASRAAFEDYDERRIQADLAIGEANRAREVAESQFGTLERERDELEKEVRRTQKTMRDLEKMLSASEERGKSLQKQLEIAETRTQQERHAADEARSRLDDMRDHLAKATAARETADRRCADLEQTGKQLAGQLQAAETRAADLDRRLEAAEAHASAERNGLDKLVDALRRQVEDANARADKIEGLIARMSTLPLGEGGHTKSSA